MRYLRLSWAPLPCWVSSFLFLHYFKSTLFLIQEGYTLQVVYHKLQLISPGYGLIQALFCKGFLRGYKWKGLYLKGIFIKKEKVLWNNLWQCWWKRILNLLVFKLQNIIISPVHFNTLSGGGRGHLYPEGVILGWSFFGLGVNKPLTGRAYKWRSL